jgi:hypothetical protein
MRVTVAGRPVVAVDRSVITAVCRSVKRLHSWGAGKFYHDSDNHFR